MLFQQLRGETSILDNLQDFTDGYVTIVEDHLQSAQRPVIIRFLRSECYSTGSCGVLERVIELQWSTSAVSLSSATVADTTPGCVDRARSTADEQDEQCIPFTDTCAHQHL